MTNLTKKEKNRRLAESALMLALATILSELAVFSLEKMSENYSGITLNNLATRIKNSFTDISDETKFMAQLAMNGFALNDYYDHFVYEQSDFRRYKVTEGFPRITPADMPKAITKVSYEISLTELSEYEIK